MITEPHSSGAEQAVPLALLVDRDANTRKLYADHLKRLAYGIEEAEDGREALAKAIATPPTVIITDTWLPGMTGFDLCKLLRQDVATRTIPIIVVTEDGYEAHVRRAKDAGADAVLVKPCLPETLLEEMHRVLERSAHLRAHGRALNVKLAGQIARSNDIIKRVRGTRGNSLARSHDRHQTTSPQLQPPTLVCPTCDERLAYQHSQIGGVSARQSEQWDYFECPRGCGVFQYRQRTRKLKSV